MDKLKLWIKTLIVSLIQIVTYLAICEIALNIRHHFISTKPDLAWGLFYYHSFYLFCILVVFGNFISSILSQRGKNISWVIFACSLLIFATFVGMCIQYTPYRSGLLLVSALIALLIRVFIFSKETVRHSDV